MIFKKITKGPEPIRGNIKYLVEAKMHRSKFLRCFINRFVCYLRQVIVFIMFWGAIFEALDKGLSQSIDMGDKSQSLEIDLTT